MRMQFNVLRVLLAPLGALIPNKVYIIIIISCFDIFTCVQGYYPLRTQHCGVICLYVITNMCLQLHAGWFIFHDFSLSSNGYDTVSDDFLLGIMTNFTILLFYWIRVLNNQFFKKKDRFTSKACSQWEYKEHFITGACSPLRLGIKPKLLLKCLSIVIKGILQKMGNYKMHTQLWLAKNCLLIHGTRFACW